MQLSINIINPQLYQMSFCKCTQKNAKNKKFFNKLLIKLIKSIRYPEFDGRGVGAEFGGVDAAEDADAGGEGAGVANP